MAVAAASFMQPIPNSGRRAASATGRQLRVDRMSRSVLRSSATVFSAILTALTVLTIVPMPVAAATPAHGRITKGAATSAFETRTTGS
jgi:hypothetical protein